MTDAELIQMLRRRLATVEGAAMDLLDVLEETGTKRRVQWERMDAEWERLNDLAPSVRGFLVCYVATMPPRLAALKKLRDALTTDLETALLSDPNVTPEQLAEWVK